MLESDTYAAFNSYRTMLQMMQRDGVKVKDGGNRLLQKGRYFDRPDLYVKTQRTDRGDRQHEVILFSRRKGAESIKINRIKYPSILGTFLPHCFVKFQ